MCISWPCDCTTLDARATENGATVLQPSRSDHQYPVHAAFGGYKQSGIGRETHLMMLDHYQQIKNLLASYSSKALGFF